MRIEAAAVQTRARFGDPEGNLARLVDAVRALEGEVDLVVLPEFATSGYNLDGFVERAAELAEDLTGPTVTAAAELASEFDTTLVVSVLEDARNGAFYDTAVVVSPSGDPVAHRKTHLYPPERACFVPGDRLEAIPTPAGALGVMICFEHAFPEIATALALAGSQILIIPSAVPNGYEHLLTLRSRTRAQDNQVFVVAANLAGEGFCGRSLIADPSGGILAEAGTEPTTIRATLDLGAIEDERTREPSLRCRRPELYAASGAPISRPRR